jgi:hypothetical protein
MAIPKTIEGREYTKFVDSPTRDKEVAVEVVTSERATSMLVDCDNENITYIGTAEFASLPSETKWRIQKIDTTSGVAVTNASNAYDQIWNNRLGLTYV